jgi:hypothetical protein
MNCRQAYGSRHTTDIDRGNDLGQIFFVVATAMESGSVGQIQLAHEGLETRHFRTITQKKQISLLPKAAQLDNCPDQQVESLGFRQPSKPENDRIIRSIREQLRPDGLNSLFGQSAPQFDLSVVIKGIENDLKPSSIHSVRRHQVPPPSVPVQHQGIGKPKKDPPNGAWKP